MKVAVTGASGHIGNCLVRELVKKGDHVKVLVHNFDNDLALIDVQLIRGNLLDIESLKKLCEGVDVVFHLAAIIALDNRRREEVFAVNVTGTQNVIAASKWAGVKKLIHFSSIDAIQHVSREMVMDETGLLVVSEKWVYAFTKAESERVVMDAVNDGFNAVILSPTAVIGPFDYRGSFLGDALLKIVRNQIPMLIRGGYNWVDVRDIAAAAVQAVESGRRGEKYILSGNFCCLRDLSELIGKISGKKTPTLLAPLFVAKLACPFFQIYYSITKRKPVFTCQSLDLLINSPKNISFEKSRKELGYKPRPLEQTLRDTLNWYIENKILN